MTEEKTESIPVKNLDWKKGEEYRDFFAEIMTVTGSAKRSVVLDFGTVEESGKKGSEEGIRSENLYIKHHTRIRVSPNHFADIVKLLNETLERTKGE